MKKIFLITFFVLSAVLSYAQFPITQTQGASTTLVKSKGGLGADSAFVVPNVDTFGVQKNYYDGLAGRASSLVFHNGKYYYRYNGKWNDLSTGTAPAGSIDSVTVSYGNFVDTLKYWSGGTGTVITYLDRPNGFVVAPVVTWDSALVFDVTAGTYYIDGTRYNSPATTITLDPADPSNPRIDAIVVNTSSVATKITGTPAASPAAPNIDPNIELLLTTVDVATGATTPTNNGKVTIYDENTEWTGSSSGVTVNFGNTNNVYHLLKATDAGTFLTGSKIAYQNSTTIDLSNYTALKFYIRLKSSFSNNTYVQVAFGNGLTAVSSSVSITNGNYGFTRTITGAYQTITIPLSAWTFTSSTANRIVFNLLGSGGGFYLDYIQLISSPISGGGSTAGVLTFNGRSGNVTPAKTDYSTYFVDSIYRKTAKDSIFYRIGSTEYAIKDSSGGSTTISFPYTTQKYLTGYNTFGAMNSDSLTEGSTNKFYTDARARAAISLTTTGSGAATYNNGTGVLNIPTPSSISTGTYAQMLAVSSPTVGQQFYVTNFISGMYVYNGTTWNWQRNGRFLYEFDFDGGITAYTGSRYGNPVLDRTSGGTVAQVASSALQTDHASAWSLSTSTSASSWTLVFRESVGNYGVKGETVAFDAIVKTPANLSDGTDSYYLWFGTAGVNSWNATGYQIRYTHDNNSGKWEARASQSTTLNETKADCGITVAANTWYRLTIITYGNGTSQDSVQYYIDGVLKSTITTNVNGGSGVSGDGALGYPGLFEIDKRAGTNARIAYIDLMRAIQLSPQ